MIRWLFSLLSFGATIYGGFWFLHEYPEVKQVIVEKIQAMKLFLEPKEGIEAVNLRYSTEEISSKAKVLLLDRKHSLLPPVLHFYPYLLLQVKFSPSFEETKECKSLWSLVSAEMITDTKKGTCSHGYADCIRTKANALELAVIFQLSKANGPNRALTKEQLTQKVTQGISLALLNPTLESLLRKRLVVSSPNGYRLHMQNPVLPLSPQTVIDHPLNLHFYTNAQVVKALYSQKEIERFAQDYFQQDFTIQSSSVIYIPIYSIGVQKGDGSVVTTYWNGVNGAQIDDLLSL